MNPTRRRLWSPDGGPLLAWYDAVRRDLPWRRTTDPYAIWVSEVMLQQTQVATVLDYYARWMARFPTVEDLAAADESDVLAAWQGLGYYRRGRYLLQGARWIVANQMPTDSNGWSKVPGVGPYTSAAIASIAFGEPVSLVDGNVERVYARLTGSRASGRALTAEARAWAARHLYRERPGDWNQALMELGATVCTPRKPKCDACPLADRCVAKRSWLVDQLPVPEPKPDIVRQHHVVWVPYRAEEHGPAFGLRQIPEGAWWAGMWEFPRVVLESGKSEEDLRQIVGPGWTEKLGSFRHQVTHHRIRVDAALVRCELPRPELRWAPVAELSAFAMPAPQRRVATMAIKLLGLEG